MVLKRRFNLGFDFQNIHKAPRSSRNKVISKRADDYDSQICAIDLLASLAGKLLEESESSSNAFEEDNHNHFGGKKEHEAGYDKTCKSTSENTSETCLQFSSLEQTLTSDCKRANGLIHLEVCETKKEDCDFLVESEGTIEETCVVNGVIADTFSLKDHVSNGAFEGYENHSKLVCRDDDENYCKSYKLSDRSKLCSPLTPVRNRIIKKYRSKKRRLSEKRLVVNYDEGLSSESVCNSPENGRLVKFSIKTLKIPELFIEVPETETVGSLKRTVIEAVTALLGDGIRIGVLVHGKKVRDDNNTLSKTGLSCRENLDKIGFTLEPGPETLHVPLCFDNHVVSIQTGSKNLSERPAASTMLESRTSCPLQDADHLMNLGDSMKISHELVPYQSDISVDEQASTISRALIPVSDLESEAFAIVPVNEKPKHKELSQRRTRRPFSVIEVEGLVQAVEELGTGRWRDVKLRSFENATHRTYVDLKDKWKTLVHTATISPHQRRGEPVPQELLDRVLSVHRNWSLHQLKHQVVVRPCKEGER